MMVRKNTPLKNISATYSAQLQSGKKPRLRWTKIYFSPLLASLALLMKDLALLAAIDVREYAAPAIRRRHGLQYQIPTAWRRTESCKIIEQSISFQEHIHGHTNLGKHFQQGTALHRSQPIWVNNNVICHIKIVASHHIFWYEHYATAIKIYRV